MDTKDFEIVELKSQLKKKTLRIKLLEEEVNLAKRKVRMFSELHSDLANDYEQLKRRFEANFKFHGYIKDVLDVTADLMEDV